MTERQPYECPLCGGGGIAYAVRSTSTRYRCERNRAHTWQTSHPQRAPKEAPHDRRR